MLKKLILLLCFLPLQSCLIEADKPDSAVATHIETEHFSLAFPVGFFSAERMTFAAQNHEKAFAELARIFPVSPQDKIKIYWVYEIKSYRPAGGINRSNNIMYSFSYYNDMNSYFDRHELVHSFQFAYFDNLNESDQLSSLFLEGMAEAFSKDFNNCDWLSIYNYSPQTDIIALDKNGNKIGPQEPIDILLTNPEWSNEAYTIGALFNRYLYLKLGNARYFDFVRKTTSHSYEESAQMLGFSFAPLVLEFKKVINSTPVNSSTSIKLSTPINNNNCELPFTPLT
jgi:hypothetical protein